MACQIQLECPAKDKCLQFLKIFYEYHVEYDKQIIPSDKCGNIKM